MFELHDCKSTKVLKRAMEIKKKKLNSNLNSSAVFLIS